MQLNSKLKKGESWGQKYTDNLEVKEHWAEKWDDSLGGIIEKRHEKYL